MARDRIAELMAIKQRQGRHRVIPSADDLEALHSTWLDLPPEASPLRDLFPARIVTLLEVAVRSWIERLIDHGAPYVERAAKLKTDLRYDFAIARSLQGGAVTLGQFIAHSVTLSSLDGIASTLSTLLEVNLLQALSSARRRVDFEHNENPDPIIPNISAMTTSLARLFSVRHVLVHEFPREKPSESDINDFFGSSINFISALDEHLTQTLFGRYPIAQQQMNIEAQDKWESSKRELELLCESIEAIDETNAIQEVQQFWTKFVEAEAERQTAMWEGGSMRPLAYYTILNRFTEVRIADLEKGIEDEGAVYTIS